MELQKNEPRLLGQMKESCSRKFKRLTQQIRKWRKLVRNADCILYKFEKQQLDKSIAGEKSLMTGHREEHYLSTALLVTEDTVLETVFTIIFKNK